MTGKSTLYKPYITTCIDLVLTMCTYFIYMQNVTIIIRIREAKKAGDVVVDVHGSYLYHKCQQQGSVAAAAPKPPLAGWESVNEANYANMASKIPKVTHGKSQRKQEEVTTEHLVIVLYVLGLLYTYLAEGTGNTTGKGAFRALQRGYTHWSSGRLDQLEVNCNHPMYCHVRCKMTPSMKAGLYHVYILLGCNGEFASIDVATCECAAG